MAPFKVVAEHESKHNVGGGFLSPDEECFYYMYGGGLPFAEYRLIQIEAHTLRETSRSLPIYGGGGLAIDRKKGILACCTWKKTYIFDSKNLSLIHKMNGGGNSPEMGFDSSSKYLVMGSHISPIVKFIDLTNGELAFRKKVSPTSFVCEGLEGNEIILGHNPSGRIICYDCSIQKIKYELNCPPFSSCVRTGDELIMGSRLLLPYRGRGIGQDDWQTSIDFSSLSLEESRAYIEHLRSQHLLAVQAQSPESGVPAQGSNDSQSCIAFVRIDLPSRSVSKIQFMDPYQHINVSRLDVSKSGRTLYAGGQVYRDSCASAISIDNFSVEAEWVFEGQVIASLLDEGRKAIITGQEPSEPDDPQKLLLVEQ